MRTKAVMTAMLAVAIGYGTAGAIVWPGGDDGGFLTLDQAASKCEQKAGGNTGKLAAGIIKCQDKMVVNAFKAKPPIDEQACEDAGITKYTSKTVVTDCPCVNPAGNAAIAEAVINSSGDLVSCDPAGTPIASLPDNGAVQISGNVPTTKDIQKADFEYLKSQLSAGRTPKVTIPSPTMLHFRGGRAGISREAYPELDPAFYDDVAKAYGDELRSLLGYHVIRGRVTSETLHGRTQAVEALNGFRITIDGSDGIRVNGRLVAMRDLRANTGVRL